MNKNLVLSTLSIVGIMFVALVLINIFHISYPISVVTSTRSSELSVVGEGKVDVVPDNASVNVGINVDNKKSTAEVQQMLDKTHNNIVDAMLKLGIKKEDITTQNYSISPAYEFVDNQNKPNGFTGSASLSIKLKKIELVSQVVQAATAAGATDIQGTSFSVENPDAYREEARNKAIQNAKEQAQKLATTSGIRLGKETKILESNNNTATVPVFGTAMSAKVASSNGPEIQPGSQTISSVVTLYFEKN
jgi:uncharacterized protein YggE